MILRKFKPVPAETSPEGNTTQLDWNQACQLAQLQVGNHQPLSIQRDRLGQELSRSNPLGFNLKQQWSQTGLL
ncbi:hypothetical protein, partial [Oceanospirillum beijerinckii]|uniref:hypothetical protein n=1 Tax=Oceanospirillum beijerinckii TaxID=64976 RepID=UPI00048860FA